MQRLPRIVPLAVGFLAGQVLARLEAPWYWWVITALALVILIAAVHLLRLWLAAD